MRLPLAAVATVLAGPAFPAAGVASFGAPIAMTAASSEVPVAIARGADGRGALVTQSGFPPYSSGTQSVVRLPGGKRTTFKDTTVLGSVGRGDGGVDLLVRRATATSTSGTLTLRRVLASGTVIDLWSVRTSATSGAIARTAHRTVVAWPSGSGVRLVSRPDGGIPTRATTARVRLAGITHLGLVYDGRGRLVIAATSYEDRLVLVSASLRGVVRVRQATAGVGGFVDLEVTPGGRVGALIEDTGIEGDSGECAGDGNGHHIRVAIRERGASRFTAVRTIESPPFGCGGSGALMRATAGEALTVVYQGGSYDRPPLLVRRADAPRGARFGVPMTVASDARGDAAVVPVDGRLRIALLRKSTQPEIFSGALSVVLDPGPEEPIDSGPAFAPILRLDAAGRPVMAWRSGARLNIAVDGA